MSTIQSYERAQWRVKIEDFVHHHTVQHFIVFLILLNAVFMGLETSPTVIEWIGEPLGVIDHFILGIFIVEIVLLMIARGWRYFLDPWGVFDFLVVGIALVPATETLAVLRALRVLRVLRLINKVESMKKVVAGLLGSLASLGSVVSLLLIVFYVAAVVATNVFGAEYPDYFGNLGKTFFSLFQVMTLESWSDGIARPVMEKFPYAWIFFVLFILIATFVVINLFIAVIVDSLSSVNKDEETELDHDALFLHKELIDLKSEMNEIKAMLLELSESKKPDA
jgi:voltage-gated sodium channel